jgi:uncharacterized protein (DUF58 family)
MGFIMIISRREYIKFELAVLSLGILAGAIMQWWLYFLIGIPVFMGIIYLIHKGCEPKMEVAIKSSPDHMIIEGAEYKIVAKYPDYVIVEYMGTLMGEPIREKCPRDLFA